MKRRNLPHSAWILLVALSVTLVHAANTELRIIELKHRTAEEVLPIVTPLMQAGSMIGGHGFQLFARTSDRQFRELERVVASIDVPRRNFKITIRQSANAQTDERLRRVEGTVQTKVGKRIIITGNTAGATVNIGTGNSQASVGYEIEHRTKSRDRGMTQVVRVLDGRRAFLRVGHAIAYIQPFLTFSRRYAHVVANVGYQEVSTGFEVLPRMRGSQVEVEITPKLSFHRGHLVEPVSFHQLSTTVIVGLGEWIDLGSAMGTSNEVTRAILDGRAHDSGHEYRVMMKVE